jgi:hypothetical protein
LEALFLNDKIKPKNLGASAGMGFKFIIENSGSFYLHCEPGRRSLVACGILLKGLRANLKKEKHTHIRFFDY